MTLFIGDKNLSSWSLRPWLLLKYFEIPFEEKIVLLDRPETTAEILKHSPSGRVPVLHDGATVVWDSLAIAEYLHDKFPDRGLWPADLALRARARSVAAEMHSGFETLRKHMPHKAKENFPDFDWRPAEKDIKRVCQLWAECLRASGGPFLFGKFSIADAMYAPVVNRFVTYSVNPREAAGADATVVANYVEAIRSLPAVRQWIGES